ncbi:MAG: anhydro-N-acetylmuramic acid kinase [Halioglobus sp.]
MSIGTSGHTVPALFVGLMSGTSIDSIDAAIVECAPNSTTIIATREHPISQSTRSRIANLSRHGDDEIEHMGRLDRELGKLFAEATLELLRANNTPANAITAIGSHGQTIRHRPPSAAKNGEECFTLQIGDPNTIAECTGITTVADFRRRDVAAGGEGAPLAPAFHRAVFASAGANRAIVNIGGIANASILQGEELTMGFDTGPGNTLLDQWILQNQGTRYDAGGDWAAEGEVSAELLQTMLSHPFLSQRGPRSTGKEAFNLDWLDGCCQTSALSVSAQNTQATLAEFTAQSIVTGLENCGIALDEVYICGGGAHNTDLMRRLYRLLNPIKLESTEAIGMDPDWVEAAAFAWLAQQSLNSLVGNAPVVTGASGPRVLGGIFPG